MLKFNVEVLKACANEALITSPSHVLVTIGKSALYAQSYLTTIKFMGKNKLTALIKMCPYCCPQQKHALVAALGFALCMQMGKPGGKRKEGGRSS